MHSTQSEAEVRALLEQFRVPVFEWGRGEAKTLQDLLDEIAAGESRLEVHEEALLRHIEGSAIDVYFDDGRAVLKLYEVKQVFADGRERVRDDIDSSLGEKLHRGEKPHDAARRAFEEELGIEAALPIEPHPQRQCRTTSKGPVPSKSFPGLRSRYVTHRFILHMPAEHYRPTYVERQPGKTTHFAWRRY